jgi:hypothetical protein
VPAFARRWQRDAGSPSASRYDQSLAVFAERSFMQLHNTGNGRPALFVTTGLLVIGLLAGMGVMSSRRRERPPARIESESDSRASDQRAARLGPENPPPPHFALPVPSFAQSAHTRAFAIKKTEDSRSSAQLFAEEKRDPVWAPAIETRVGSRTKQANDLFIKGGFPEIKISEPDCRESTCALNVTYPEDAPARAQQAGFLKQGESPLGHVLSELGPLAQISSESTPELVTNPDGTKSERKQVYLVFGPKDADPAQYDEWAAQALAYVKKLHEAKATIFK